jgi:hypothetical protein
MQSWGGSNQGVLFVPSAKKRGRIFVLVEFHDNIEKILDLFIFKKIIAKKCNNKKIMSNQFFLSYKFVIEKDVLSGINLSQKFFLSDKTFDQKIFCQIKLLVRNFSCLSCFRSFLIGKQFC